MRLETKVKTKGEIAAMRAAGSAIALTLKAMEGAIIRGERNTLRLDELAAEHLASYGASPAFLGYKPPFSDRAYEYVSCISVNNEVVHGIPSEKKVLKDGDIVSLDLGASVDGWFADAAITVPVGTVSSAAKNLILSTRTALIEGFKFARPGRKTGDIGWAIYSYAQRERLYIADGLCGHGIGTTIHEEPEVPNAALKGTGSELIEGMTIAIEPMLCLGTSVIVNVQGDPWTLATADGSLAAHFEHTVLITSSGPVVLTMP